MPEQDTIEMELEGYWIIITANYMTIGCQTYLNEEWFNLTDDQFAAMGPNTLDLWNTHKETIREAIDSLQPPPEE